MRILLAEDDLHLGDALRAGLQLQGFIVDWVRDGFAASHELQNKSYSACVLDIAMPRQTGLEVLMQMRNDKNKIPVLMLTARDANQDISHALDMGADDYVVKPVDLQVLAARLRALVRRSLGLDTAEIKFGELSLCAERHELRISGELVNLSRREYALLEALMLANGRVLTRENLEQQLYAWGQEVDSNAVEVHIHNLRKKIGKDTIQTLRGIGYQIKQNELSR